MRVRRSRLIARRGNRALFYRGPVWSLAALLGTLLAVFIVALVTTYVIEGAITILVAFLVWAVLALRVVRLEPAGPSGDGPDPGGAGVREPRRPLPMAPAGAAALPLPEEDPPLAS
jgi:hypothetical protein